MTSTRFKLGDLIEQYSERCGNRSIKHSDISGVNRDKEFFPSKLVGENVSNYKVVPSGYFACNLMHVGRDVVLPIAHNSSKHEVFVSPAYTVFSIKNEVPLNPRYLEMWFKSDERDRYFWMHTDSSIRDGMTFDDMCDIEIDLPPVEVQKKYVDIYNAMLKNQKSYEEGLNDLKTLCDAYIEELRRKIPSEVIGQYITRHDVRNGANGTKNVMGISTSKEFREPTSKVNKNELSNYKIVKPRQIGFVQTTHNEKVFAYAFNDTENDIVISSVNEVFSCNEDYLLPEYLSLFLSRTEFDRYARFHSWGSARETFTWLDLVEVKIPIPDINKQQAIANVYRAYKNRKSINERLREQVIDICPILIKGSLEEANK